jgi:hypothetical protein
MLLNEHVGDSVLLGIKVRRELNWIISVLSMKSVILRECEIMCALRS